MVRFITCAAILLFTTNVVIAEGTKSGILPPCEGQGCHLIAETITLPEATTTTDLKIRIGSMIMEIPSPVTRIDMAQSVTVFRYETSPSVMISVETSKTVPFLNVKSQPVSLSDAMRIIFTKTPKDQDISEKYGPSLLNQLMWAKKELLGKSGKAFVYHRGRISIYYASNSGDPYKNLAWAIDSKYPDIAIRLESNHLQNDFLKMLYSIRLLQEKEK